MPMTPINILLAILTLINLTTFFLVAHDKYKAKRGRDTKRTPEGYMFFLAAAFGSIGVYLGMQIFRHKTRKWYFQLGIPLLIVQNLSMIYLMSEILIK